jgi:beta-aspartyl-peptidase (threonine type)
MDAAIMDGETLDIGAVCGVRGVDNPVSAARTLLRERETLMAAPARGGADHPPTAPAGCDTVGCVALDVDGRIAVAVSTGGLSGARPGRVGDTPLPGCGFYADSRSGAVAATGVGESISRTLLSARVALALENEVEPQAAVEQALARLGQVGGDAGLIALDARGRIGWAHRGGQFAIAWAAGPAPHLHVEIAGLEDADE